MAWRGLHVLDSGPQSLPALTRLIHEALGPRMPDVACCIGRERGHAVGPGVGCIVLGRGENEAKVFSTVRATRVLWAR